MKSIIGRFRSVKKSTKYDYKGEYQRLFPTKMSSSGFLTLYSLYLLDAKDEPMYGREILEEISDVVDRSIWSPSHGTLYPVLGKMVKSGLICAVEEKNSRKYYSITEKGRDELKNRLDEFKTMLASSNDFFCKVMKKMYM